MFLREIMELNHGKLEYINLLINPSHTVITNLALKSVTFEKS